MRSSTATYDSRRIRQFRRIRTTSFALLLALFVIGFFQRFSPATFAQSISSEFGISASELGLFAAVNFWVYTILQVPAGVLIDRYGTRVCVGVGGILTAAGSLIIAGAPTYSLALVGPALIGLGTCGIFVGLMKNNAAWFPASHYGLITGITMFVGNIGSVTAEGPAAVLLTVFSWRSIFLAVGILAAVVSVASILLIRDSPAAAGLADLSPEPPPADEAQGRLPLTTIVRSKQLWAVFFAVVGTNGTFYAFSGLWGVPLLTDGFDLSNADAATYTTIALVVYGCGNFVIGFLSDRVGRRKPFIMFCSISAVVGWTGLALLPWSPGWTALTLYMLVGLAGSQVVPAFAAVKEAVRPAAAATSLAVVNVGAFLASGLIQPAFGWILDQLAGARGSEGDYQLADYRIALIIPLVLAVIGLVSSIFTNETRTIS